MLLTSIISFIKYDDNIEKEYRNSDATWHTLLTIEGYNETPIKDHLFLPIVSLGDETDKNIPWGATVPDIKGNYYYTSFSPAGYFLPWLFMKTFNLNVCEKSLYIFNSVLFSISAALLSILIFLIFKNKKISFIISIISLIIYTLSPEILHGMGMVYWHQSVMQVTLLIQLLSWYKIKNGNSKLAKIVFYLITLINPYIEWTGFIANMGYAFVELFYNWKENKKTAFINFFIIGFLTVSSFIIFSVHYLLRIDINTFILALKNRFLLRGIESSTRIIDVLSGYLYSFLNIWILLIILIIWNIIKNKKIEFTNRWILLILLFPILENILMKQHAFEYSYDRMKLIFILSILICELSYNLIKTYKNKVLISAIIIIITSYLGISNYKSYNDDLTYKWETDYKNNNIILANYVNQNYSDSVLMSEGGVRGYINLLFGRGIYEYGNIKTLINLTKTKNKRYGVFIKPYAYKILSIIIYDNETDKTIELFIKEGNIDYTNN